MRKNRIEKVSMERSSWKELEASGHECVFCHRVVWGYSIKKRNVSPLLFSVECRPHCFTHNRTLMIGFTFLLFTSFSCRSPSHVRTEAILMDSCLAVPLLLFWHQKRKEIPVGFQMYEWSYIFCQIQLPWGRSNVCESIFYFDDFWNRKPSEGLAWKLPGGTAFMFW